MNLKANQTRCEGCGQFIKDDAAHNWCKEVISQRIKIGDKVKALPNFPHAIKANDIGIVVNSDKKYVTVKFSDNVIYACTYKVIERVNQ